jgi:hypothetical protein
MSATVPYSHRVTRAVAEARQDLAEVADVSVWSMRADETMATIDEVLRTEDQLAEIKARLLSHAQQIQLPAKTGSTSTANWHAHRTRTDRRAAHRTMRLAGSLQQHEATRTALAEGKLHAEQAQVILDGLQQLPADLDPDLVEQAEHHLIKRARDFDAKGLKHLARRLEVIAPDVADAHEAQLLEQEEGGAAKPPPSPCGMTGTARSTAGSPSTP